MIAIIDYNTCNVGSIQNMFRKLGIASMITNKPTELNKADRIILPGVGAFDKGMQNLKSLNLVHSLNEHANNSTPILGICLGFQLLTNKSEEGGSLEKGLGWIDAETIKFNFSNPAIRVPHMGWNNLINVNKSVLFEGIQEDHRFYFVHSYFVKCNNSSDIAASTEYNGIFTSSIQKNNIFGVQFHPEKSHKHGMQVLRNFAEYNK
jgi:imidazole glycerol-phosphate synthase subunit HisH